MAVLRKELCALKFRKMHRRFEKNIKTCFLLIKMERNAYITSALVYCTVQCVFCFKLVVWKVQEMPQ